MEELQAGLFEKTFPSRDVVITNARGTSHRCNKHYGRE